MVRKQVSQLFLLAFAALAVTVEFVGFISPGWLCLSAKYDTQSDPKVALWADDLVKSFSEAGSGDSHSADNSDSKWANFDQDNHDRDRRQDQPNAAAGGGRKRPDGDRNRTTEPLRRPRPPFGKGNFTFPSSAEQQEVYGRFRQWVHQNNINNLSLPSNVTEFRTWIYSEKDKVLYFTLKNYFDKFMDTVKNETHDKPFYLSVIESWFRGGLDNVRPNVPKPPEFQDGTDLRVNAATQAAIYTDFKAYVDPTLRRRKLPNKYAGFIAWMSQDTDRIEKMEVQYEYFMEEIYSRYANASKVEQYEEVIESWFVKAYQNNKTDEDESFSALAMLAGMEWRVRLGIWYGKECVSISDNVDEKCVSTNAVRIEENGLDVGGMATWNDLRVETIIGLCAGAVGLVGTLLTVKPFCLKGRQRMTTIVGVCGMVISWILFLVPIIRIAGINSTLKQGSMFSYDEMELQMPWAAAVSGIGACLALVTAGLLAFFTWADERQKWSRFEEDPSVIFKNDVQGNKGTCDKDEKGTSNTEGTYDNIGTMSDI